MKRNHAWIVTGICGLMVCAMAETGLSQGVRPVSAPNTRPALTILHLTPPNRVRQLTPVYTTSATMGSTARPREWGVFEANFRTTPEWIDEIVVTFSILAERKTTEAGPRYSFFQTTARYADIPRDEHNVCMVLPPATLQRYADQVIAFAVEIATADGTLLAAQTEVAGSSSLALPAGWWRKPEVTESKNVAKRGGLVDRSKTPFGLINIDDYEAVK